MSDKLLRKVTRSMPGLRYMIRSRKFPDFREKLCCKYTDPSYSIFHLALYGELFGPDFDIFLDSGGSSSGASCMLRVGTQLQFIKYCVPGYSSDVPEKPKVSNTGADPRIALKQTGHFANYLDERGMRRYCHNHTLFLIIDALHLQVMIKKVMMSADVDDFSEDFLARCSPDVAMEQRDLAVKLEGMHHLLYHIVMCQGLDLFEMMWDTEHQWDVKLRVWR
ncbi:hypothetical protein F5Y16DRAFT_382841 [Xylariaceae sp. FL0255]|nr:hypothetical protein F5Y16DRAFT_382841 [Xylariaceae sp. FL0255]